jgi:hypothetical protein
VFLGKTSQKIGFGDSKAWTLIFQSLEVTGNSLVSNKLSTITSNQSLVRRKKMERVVCFLKTKTSLVHGSALFDGLLGEWVDMLNLIMPNLSFFFINFFIFKYLLKLSLLFFLNCLVYHFFK